MGFREPMLGSEVPQDSEVGYSPGSRMQGVSSKEGLGYSSHLGRGRGAAVPPDTQGLGIGRFRGEKVLEERPPSRGLGRTFQAPVISHRSHSISLYSSGLAVSNSTQQLESPF